MGDWMKMLMKTMMVIMSEGVEPIEGDPGGVSLLRTPLTADFYLSVSWFSIFASVHRKIKSQEVY
jgi:hypothetical protein